MDKDSPNFQGSIFADELFRIVQARGKGQYDLQRVPFNLERRKVQAVAASLTSMVPGAVFNKYDIETIAVLLGLTPDERLRIYAALFAFGVQLQVRPLMSEQDAWQIATHVRNASLNWLREKLRQGEQPIRGDNLDSTVPVQVGDSFVEALDTFDIGAVLAATSAVAANDEAAAALIERALALFEHAAGALDQLEVSDRQGDDWQWHRTEVETAINCAYQELDMLRRAQSDETSGSESGGG